MIFKVAKKLSIVIIGLSLSACLPAGAGTEDNASADATSGTQATTRASASTSNPVVSPSFNIGGTSWSNGEGVLLYRFTAIERDGDIVVCGAYAGEGLSFVSQANRELLRRSAVAVDGEVVLRNLAFFRKASAEMLDARLVGSETGCKSTGLAAGSVPLEAVKVELRPGRIRIRV